MQQNYDPNKNYAFTDKDGNTFYSKGDNGYVWQAITEGVPISINDKGEWYVDPYLEVTPDKVVAHMPEWFKQTPEYTNWKDNFSQYIQPGINKDTFNQLNDILKQHGQQGLFRKNTTDLAKSYGITDNDLLERSMQNTINLGAEMQGIENDGITLYNETKSAADWAREIKNYSKEELSAMMQDLNKTLAISSGKEKGAWTGDRGQQEAALYALNLSQLLNAVDDNYKQFGDGKEFEGLLQASALQKTTAVADSTWNVILKTPLAIPARLAHGFLSLGAGKGFDTRIEQYTDPYTRPEAGAYLEGTDAFIKAGNFVGGTLYLGMMITASRYFGISEAAEDAASSAAYRLFGTASAFATKPIGAAVEFTIWDFPNDFLNFFTTASENGWDWGKAWNDPEQKQNMIPIPIIGDLIPWKGDAGLKNDLIGDIVINFGGVVASLLAKGATTAIDDVTNGLYTRIKEQAAVGNLKIQEKLTNIPVFGTGWKKMINSLMGAQNAAFIREARKTAIAEGSMDAYRRAQNLLVIKNRGGEADVFRLYNKLLEGTGTLDDIRKFKKLVNKYGGGGSTTVEWKETKGGEVKNFKKTVDDVLPQQVKQGLLDIERLSELKGQQLKMNSGEGGIIFDVATQREIARLEAKVEKLPDEIKEFANKMSDLNKRVEQLAVDLGISNEDWYKAMLLDPEFEKYMTRQALVPGKSPSGRVGSGESPAQITKSRKGYYAKNYIDPFVALNMKVQALGRAFAWHQQAKALVSFQIAQGKLAVGKGGVEAATKMVEIKSKLAEVEAVRKQVDYDGTLKGMSAEVDTIRGAVGRINTLLSAPENISMKSIYTSYSPPEMTEFVDTFSTGKIKFGDGVKDSVGLSDVDADFMVKNTYHMITPDGREVVANADNAKAAAAGSNVKPEVTRNGDGSYYNEGIAPNGTAYRYVVQDNEIKSVKEITDPAAMANTIKRLGGIHSIDAETVRKLGVKNTRAINRTILFYRDNMPNLPIGSTFRTISDSAYGYIPWASGGGAAQYKPKIVNGHIECDAFPIYLCSPLIKAGGEENTLAHMRVDVANGFHPKNSVALENTPIHESGHNTMMRLALLELNADIDSGKLKIPKDISETELGEMMQNKYFDLHERLATRALEKIGVDVNALIEKFGKKEFYKVWQGTAWETISHYAGKENSTHAYRRESFAEAVVDFWANGDNAARFSIALVNEMRNESQKYSMAASPRKALDKNGIAYDAKMFKGEQYNFPASVKSRAQKAQWLAKKRAENPYLKGKGTFSTDDYIKANQWDTFFKKEAESYSTTVKSSSPKKLIEKNGDFIENLANNTAKKLVDEIKQASVEGFDQRLAMIALGQHSGDVKQAIDDFIVSRINASAERIAAKMDGGATAENLNIARVTLWQDETVKRDMSNLMSTLSSEMSQSDVNKAIDTLFDEQAKGFASIDSLSVDYKNLNEEYKKAAAELESSNKAARAAGKKADKRLKKEGFTDDTTQTIHYIEGGEDVYVVVGDPAVASILKNPNNYAENGHTVSGLVAAANTISRMYRLGTTGLNPLSLVRNVLRDPLQATFTAGYNPLTMAISPEMFYRTLRQFGLDDDTIVKVTDRLKNWSSQTTMTAALRQIGGETPGTAAYRNKAEGFIKRFNNKVGNSKIMKWAEAPMEAWESAFRNQVAEQSFIKTMKRTDGDINKSLASAMFDASNATTDFSHAIGKFNNAISTIPYLSSAINGTASFWRLFNNDPLGMVGRLTAGFMVPVMAITAWNLGSEERRKAYMNLPEWFRDGHLVIVDMEGNIYAVPIPDEISQFAGTARRLMEYTNDANRYSIPSILAQGAFGFLPVDVDGYFNEDGTLNFSRGTGQMLSALSPQAITAIYEFAAQEKLYTGQDISNYDTLNKMINLLGNVFGSSAANIANDIGFLCGASNKRIAGNTTIETLSRDLFGIGFKEASDQFMALIGNPSSVDPVTKKEKKATGLFAESESIAKQLEQLDKDVAIARTDEEKQKLYKQKEKIVEDFGKRVAGLVNNYMQLYSITGGLEDWQKKKLIQILGMGGAVSSAPEGSYQGADASQADLNEYALGRQRYIDLGLPTNPTIEALIPNESGNLTNTLELQAAIDSFYGAPKQATQDYKNAIEKSGLKDIRNEFYDAIEKIYDRAEELGIDPDYDLIEKIQARYLQSVDAVLVPIINQYGMSILNNNDFIDAVRRQVNGMIPSDDWRQSRRNAKRFLSSKDYPTATVDVKKWLKERYSSGMRNRGLSSDAEVTQKLDSIKQKIDSGQTGAARGEIEDLRNGINRSAYYISSTDYQKLLEYYNMVK